VQRLGVGSRIKRNRYGAKHRKVHVRRKSLLMSVSAPLALVVFAGTLGGVLAEAGNTPVLAAPTSAVTEFQPTTTAIAPSTTNGRYGGRTMSIDIDPSTTNNVLAGTESGGVFRSTNGGTQWQHIAGLVPYRISDVRYVSNSIVLSTTARNGDTQNPGGIWRSTDGGITWARPATASTMGCGANYNAWGIGVDTAGGAVYAGTDCGLAWSSDQGATWTLVASVRVQAVAIAAANTIDVCRNDGHVRYTRSGGTLTPGAVVSPGGECGTSQISSRVHNIAVSALEANVLFVVQATTSTTQCGGTVMNPAGIGRLQESDDGGANWTAVSLLCGTSRAPWVRTVRSRDGNATHIDVYASAGLNVHRITCNSGGAVNRCATATMPVVPSDHVDLQDIAFAAGATCPSFVADDGGVENTTDCGANFHMVAGSGAGNGNFNALQIYEVNGQILPGSTRLFVGTQDNHLWHSSNGGTTWPDKLCCEGFHFELPRTSATATVPTLARGSPFANWRTGPPWPNENPPLSPSGWNEPPNNYVSAEEGSPFLVPGTTNTWFEWRLAGTTYTLYRSTDNAATWTAVPGGTTTSILAGPLSVKGTSANPTIYQAVCTTSFCSIGPSIAILRIDNALTATAMSPATVTQLGGGLGNVGNYYLGYGSWLVHSPAFGVDPADPRHLIVADVSSNQMKVSTDSGVTWTVDNNLTSLVTAGGRYSFNTSFWGSQAQAIAFDPTNAQRILVGTQDGGIIASTDGGTSWGRLFGSDVVPNVSSFFFGNGTIYASSYGRGLWKVDLGLPANLHVTKSVDKTNATGGDLLTYTVTITNRGTGTATSVHVDDTLPNGTVQSADLADIPAGATVTRTYTYRVPCDTADNTVLVNRVQVSDTNLKGLPDSDPTDNAASASTTVHTPVITFSKTATTSANAGEAITFTISYNNVGSGAAADVVITDVLPAEVYYSTALDLGAGPRPTTVTYNADGTITLRWSIGALPANSGPQTITYTARASLLVLAGTTLTNSASLTATNGNGCVLPTRTASATDLVTEVAPSRNPLTLGYWRNHAGQWTAEILARIQATDQRFDGADGSAPDGMLSLSEVQAAFHPPGGYPRVTRWQLLAGYFNLATRRINASTAISSALAARLGITNVRGAGLYAQGTLSLPLNKSTKARYSDTTTLWDEINNNVSERY
jgi:uncharacterized repeat protein (TIGR01451 family)